MAVSYNTFVSFVHRTSGIAPANGDYTGMCWYFSDDAAANGYVPFINVNGIGTYTEYAAVFIGNDKKAFLEISNGGAPSDTVKTDIQLGTWIHFAYTRSGTSHKFYINGQLIDTLTMSFAAVTFTEVGVGNDGAGFNDSNVKVQQFREWTSALTAAEIIAEANSSTPVKATPFTNNPLVSTYADTSGNAHTLSSTGTAPTFDADAVNFDPTNTTSGTALVMVPETEYISVPVTGGTVPTNLWFKTTAPAIYNNIKFNFFSNGDYVGESLPYESDATTPINGAAQQNIGNRPYQFPVVSGQDYFVRVNKSVGDNGGITAQFVLPNNLDVPIGSLLISADVGGWRAGALSATADEMLRYFEFVANEGLAVLDDGTILAPDTDSAGDMALYNNQLVKLQTITSDYNRWVCPSGDRTFFYVGDIVGGHSSVTTVNADGSFGPRTWILPSGSITGFQGMAVSPDDTILYYRSGSGTSPRAIKRWDLVNDVALTDLVAILPNYAPGSREILCLKDGKVVVAYYRTTFTVHNDYFFRIFNPDGTLFAAYGPFPLYYVTQGFRLAYAATDPTHFWVWSELASEATSSGSSGWQTGIGSYIKIKVSDGTVPVDRRRQLYWVNGQFGDYPDPSVSPQEDFGPSESCSFVELREAIDVSPPGKGTIIVVKVTDPADDSTSFDFTSDTLGSFSLAGGESQTFDNLTPGVFDVAETAVDDFTSTIVVSNGDDPSAITVGADEVVTVTVTNYKLEPLSGLYILTPNKRYDTLYLTITHPGGVGSDPVFTTEDLKIPEPSATLFLAGDE